ncbi:MAG TPA: IS630 family transposase [Fimbriiglobus sp.]|nr:IS630 family transposase [Fimbriiglobus sp.]
MASADRPRFVAAMEEVLDTYQARYDAKHPLIAMDEAARQLLSDVFDPLPLKPGRPRRVDDKYDRHGTCSLFMFYNPLDGWRRVGCRDSRTACDWAEEVRHLLEVDYAEAEWVTLVCDNLNTHHIASLYKAFDAETAGRLRRRLRLVPTPVNGSWLNVAEMELSVLSRQCLGKRRFETKAEMEAALTAWAAARNTTKAGTRWQFTTADARVKLKALYPIPDIER